MTQWRRLRAKGPFTVKVGDQELRANPTGNEIPLVFLVDVSREESILRIDFEYTKYTGEKDEPTQRTTEGTVTATIGKKSRRIFELELRAAKGTDVQGLARQLRSIIQKLKSETPLAGPQVNYDATQCGLELNPRTDLGATPEWMVEALEKLRDDEDHEQTGKAKELVRTLMAENLEGQASTLVETESARLRKIGDVDSAAELHRVFGELLSGRRNWGWAFDEYYRAAAVYLANGRLPDAGAVLTRAQENLRDDASKARQGQLSRHIGILTNDTYSPREQLALLQKEFLESEKYDWRASCEVGLEKVNLMTDSGSQIPKKPSPG